jgi:hypothetical protein
MKTRVILTTAMLAMVLSLAWTANACQCGPDSPNGTVTCQADCVYPDTCRFNSQDDPLSYCYHDNVGACFNGGYDPCCDPTCFGF